MPLGVDPVVTVPQFLIAWHRALVSSSDSNKHHHHRVAAGGPRADGMWIVGIVCCLYVSCWSLVPANIVINIIIIIIIIIIRSQHAAPPGRERESVCVIYSRGKHAFADEQHSRFVFARQPLPCGDGADTGSWVCVVACVVTDGDGPRL